MDATNNKNVTGIPYYLYQTSSTYAESIDYVLDNMYDLDNNLEYVMSDDSSKDWWIVNEIFVESSIDIANAFSKSYDMGYIEIEGNKVLAIKNLGGLTDVDLNENSIMNLAQTLYSKGFTEEELMNTRLGCAGGYIIMIY